MIGIRAVLEQAAYSPVNDPIGRSMYYGPKGYPRDGSVTGVIFAHAAGGTEQDTWSSASVNVKTIMQTVAQTRPVIAPSFTGDQWGNDLSILQMTDAYNYLTGPVYGAKTGKIILMARSMGHLTVSTWARQNLSKVSAICVLQGVSDLLEYWTRSPASINAAYGGAYSNATYGATHDPTVFAAELDGIPWRNYYAVDDTTVPPATITTLAGKIAGGQAIPIGVGGHADPPLANVDLTELLTWLDSKAV